MKSEKTKQRERTEDFFRMEERQGKLAHDLIVLIFGRDHFDVNGPEGNALMELLVDFEAAVAEDYLQAYTDNVPFYPSLPRHFVTPALFGEFVFQDMQQEIARNREDNFAWAEAAKQLCVDELTFENAGGAGLFELKKRRILGQAISKLKTHLRKLSFGDSE